MKMTALHFACGNKDAKTARLLVEHGALKSAASTSSVTPLSLGVEQLLVAEVESLDFQEEIYADDMSWSGWSDRQFSPTMDDLERMREKERQNQQRRSMKEAEQWREKLSAVAAEVGCLSCDEGKYPRVDLECRRATTGTRTGRAMQTRAMRSK